MICIIVATGIIIKPKITSSMITSKVNSYDYSNDIEEFGHISKEGAIKIALKNVKDDILQIDCNLNENKTGYSFGFNSETVEPQTYWSASYDFYKWNPIGEKGNCVIYVDYYTGEILGNLSTI